MVYLHSFFYTVDLECTHSLRERVDGKSKWWGPPLSFLSIIGTKYSFSYTYISKRTCTSLSMNVLF